MPGILDADGDGESESGVTESHTGSIRLRATFRPVVSLAVSPKSFEMIYLPRAWPG